MSPGVGAAADRLAAQGVAAYRAGQLAEAMRCAEALLAGDPDHPQGLHLLAMAAARQGDPERALAVLEDAAARLPHQAEFPYQHGLILARLDRLEAALPGFDAALRQDPGHAGALLNRSIALHHLGRLPAALAGFETLLRLQPGLAAAWTACATTLEAVGRLPEAIAAEARAVALLPGDAAAQRRFAMLLGRAGEPEAALAHLAQGLALAPGDAEMLLGRALLLQMARRHAEAVGDLRAILATRADHPKALAALAVSLTALGDWAAAAACRAQALEAHDRALAERPGELELRRARVTLLYQSDRFAEVLTALDDLAPDEPDAARTLADRGLALFALQREAEALRCYEEALALRPEAPRVRYHAAMHRMALGDLAAGWAQYECRWQVADFPAVRRNFPAPPWLGQGDIAGRRVLLHAEQGIGDTLQFCRYAALVAARGAEVLLEVQPPLVTLMQRLAGPARILTQGAPLPGFDLHCPLMSLPLACGTTLDSIPAAVPYLSAGTEHRARWRDRLGPAGGRRIGLVWAGNSAHGNDARRSMSLAAAAPLLRQGHEVIGLQHEVPARDRATLAVLPELRLLGPECRDFMDTAALVSLLDVVVTVDTAVAHLAGALGRPVFLLLPLLTEWRWLLRREDSPWYPTARLFRQAQHGDWDGVVARVASALVA